MADKPNMNDLEPLLSDALRHIAECNGRKPAEVFKVDYLGAMANSLLAIAIIELARYNESTKFRLAENRNMEQGNG